MNTAPHLHLSKDDLPNVSKDNLPKGPFLVWPLLALLAGCAALKMPERPIESITAERQNRSEEAVREFERNRDFAEYQAALARWNQGDVDGCEETLEKLLGRNPDHRDARALLTNVLLIRETSEAQSQLNERPTEAATVDSRAANATASDADSSRGSLQLASLAEDVPRRLVKPTSSPTSVETADGSAENADGTESAEPAESGPAGTLLERGRAALAEGSPEKAAACFRAAVSIRPQDLRIPVSAAVSALQANQPELAIELLTEAKSRFGDSAQIHRILGTAYYRLGDFESSQVALRQALSLDKSSGLTYFLLGCTLAKLGDSESAEEHFRQARALDPKYAARQ